MSIDATRWAWSLQGIRPTQKLVLLSLADRAGENHVCWPSLQRLAFDTGLDVKTIRTCLIDLAQAGIVSRREVRGRGYEYTLVGVEGRENQTILTDYRKTASKKPFSENATPTSFGMGIDNHQDSNDNFLDTPTSLGTPTKTGTGTDLGTPPLPVSVPHPYQNWYPNLPRTDQEPIREPRRECADAHTHSLTEAEATKAHVRGICQRQAHGRRTRKAHSSLRGRQDRRCHRLLGHPSRGQSRERPVQVALSGSPQVGFRCR